MADYVALQDDAAPVPAVSPASSSSSSASAPVSIPNDPSNIPLSASPVHPHLLFSRLLSFWSRPLCNRVVFFLFPLFLVVLAACMLTVGVSERNSPSSHQLSLWLIVAAVLTAILAALSVITLIIIIIPHRPSSPHPTILIPALLCSTTVHTAVTLCWFVVGNVWFSLTSRDASAVVVRTVFWVLVWLYAQLMVQLMVSVVGWSVRRGCPCIKRSEEATRMEEERMRQEGLLVMARGVVGGGAQYI